MKKFKIDISLFVLIALCVFCHKFLLMLNYLFALILHELAHMLIASKRGYKIKYVKLSMFGLSVQLDEEIASQDAFAINIAGPLCNLILSVVCLACFVIWPSLNGVLNRFCSCNLVLAFFNLLPVYPLDGGKIFKNIFKSNKAYKIADLVVRCVLSATFAVLFICSIWHNINLFYLLFALFFILSKPNLKPNLSLFKAKTKQNKYEKVALVKVDGSINLFDLLKKVNNHQFTIFYCANTNAKFIDEDNLVGLALKYPLNTQISKIA